EEHSEKPEVHKDLDADWDDTCTTLDIYRQMQVNKSDQKTDVLAEAKKKNEILLTDDAE
ncbi:hypothetical protein GOP47_0006612, partial [Adiantum capillus-veneris]